MVPYAEAMTVVWVILAVMAGLFVACIGFVGWRDRRRLSSADDTSAGRTALAEAERHAAGRHGAQGSTWDRGRADGFL